MLTPQEFSTEYNENNTLTLKWIESPPNAFCPDSKVFVVSTLIFSSFEDLRGVPSQVILGIVQGNMFTLDIRQVARESYYRFSLSNIGLIEGRFVFQRVESPTYYFGKQG